MDSRVAQTAKKAGRRGGTTQSASGRHKLEWVIGVLSTIAVVAMLGLLTYEAVTNRSDTPSFRFVVEGIDRTADGYYVTIRIRNTGDRVASAVEVEGALTRDGNVVETAEMTVDYIPSHSERGGGLVFRNDPAEAELRIEVRGYAAP